VASEEEEGTAQADASLRFVLRRAQAGDGRAFAALIRHFDPGLRILAFRLLGNRERMEDALQEAYLRAFRALPGFRGESSIGTWLYRVVYNTCLDELRRERRSTELTLHALDEEPEGVHDPAETLLRTSAVWGALMALPLEERAAVLLVDGQGLRYADAAAVLGVPIGTVASRLNRARPAMRRALEEAAGAEER
jgi:RNA polymerase sigma-70 factor (ECF subfamily)